MKSFKKSIVVAMLATVCQFGGCGAVLQDLALSAAWEFIWDNDNVLDFFGDESPGLITG